MNRKTVLVTLIVSQIIYVISVVAWLFVLGMSVMGFDSPQAQYDMMTWLIFIYILIYPLAMAASAVTAWVLFARRRHRSALLWNGIPLLWIVPLFALLIYVFVA
ncbi:hypothetical protein GZH47_06420 [Paenibacillus rhizovicinus]|uniref:Uncharacterized protein n=1 Tax=Paenibacillus rhizovicinus TaxID=2704463 RepID=A0A6C0P1B6_9BACL|nr:hypothetical protein [Paenibacillus rhizovicinus]QHW30522.1 hypothetical protein GZH47_06420 [Paenibacillus rhizovicinus]